MALGLAGCGSGGTSGSSSSGTGSSSGTASDSSSDSSDDDNSADSGEFNPDKAEDAMTIEELREANGVEVEVDSSKKLGVVMKSLSNEFWRTLQEGYEAAAKDTGLDIDIQATTDESDEIGQQTMTETLVIQGADALLMSPISDF